MSIPNAPSTADLKAGLNVIGRNVRTYRFKLNANWNIKPLKPLTQFSSKDFKNISELTKALNEQKGLMDELKGLKKTADTVKKTTETANETKGLWDKFLSKIPGGGSNAVKAAAVGSFLSTILVFGGLAVLLAFLQKFQQEINESGFVSIAALQKDLTATNTTAVNVGNKVRVLEGQIKTNTLDNQRTRDRIYGLEKQNIGINDNIDKAKKNANDALFEARKGREIVEKKINDNLYEFRQTKQRIESQYTELKTSFNKYIGGLNDGFQKKIEATVNTLQKSLNTANTEIKKANDTISLQQKTLDTTAKIAKALPASITTGFKAVQDTTKKILDAAITPVQQSTKKWGITITPATVTPATVTISESGGVTVTPVTVTPATVTQTDFSSTDIARSINAQNDKQDKQIATLGGGLSAVATAATAAQNTANAALNKGTSIPDLSGVRADISRVQTDLNKTKADLTTIDTKIKEQEKVNAEGNKKLDQLFPLVSGLPLIVGRAEQNIINKLPTPEDLANAAATGVCRSTKPGGCMSKALNDTGNDIKTNANNNTGATLDAINAGLNGALLAGQQTILTRLGAQLPGGIGGKLGRMADWLQLGRALDVLTFAATVHNAVQLSNDIGVTLGSALANVLSLIGIKDDTGNPLDISSIINSTVQNLVKGIVGDEQYSQLSTAWAKANRIYQASTNILNSFQSLSSAVLSGLEITAGRIGKIGNALRNAGEVLDNAYGWMNPQPKFNRVTQTLENLQQGASTIQMVTQAPLDIINATTELTTATTEFAKAIKEDDKPANKGISEPEPDVLKASLASSKLASAGLELADLDLEEDE